MNEIFERTAMLFGVEAIERLGTKKVIVFGIGGVGGYVCETLCRSGVGRIAIVDKDTVSVTNINRQIIATSSVVGMYKTDVMEKRLLDINPSVKVDKYTFFYLPETADLIDLSDYDYIVDAIDNVTAKLELAVRAKQLGVPVIASMGTGNKTDPTRLRVVDISKTTTCPLAKVMRRELRVRGIAHMKVVFSDEEPKKPQFPDSETGKTVPASSAFVPPTAGLLIARQVVLDLIASGETEDARQC